MTAPSASWGTETVAADYRAVDGSNRAGNVTFTAPVDVVCLTDGVIFRAPPDSETTFTSYC